MTAEADRYEECAARLRRATVTQVPCAPVRDLLAGDDVSGAYRVQQLNVAASGQRRVGRKIGLTSEAQRFARSATRCGRVRSCSPGHSARWSPSEPAMSWT